MGLGPLAVKMPTRHRHITPKMPFNINKPLKYFMMNFPPVRSDTSSVEEGTVIAIPYVGGRMANAPTDETVAGS
jgi:hypothetical protein